MSNYATRPIGLLLLFVLAAGLYPNSAHADGDDHQKAFRLYATAAFGPIGSLYSSGSVAINGRRTEGQQMVWGGDLIETLDDASAGVMLDAIGQVTLRNGAMVRLSTKPAGIDEDKSRHILVASLADGDMVVKLDNNATAYIEAGGSAYTTSWGASFRIGVLEGRVIIHESSGSVKIEPYEKQLTFVTIQRLGSGSNFIRIPKTRVNLGTKQRRRIDGLAEKGSKPSTNRLISYTPGITLTPGKTTQSTQIANPAADRMVRFSVDPPSIGQIVNAADQVIDEAPTDSQGLVTVYFRAGDKAAAGLIKANILPNEEDLRDGIISEPYEREVSIRKLGFFRRNRNKLLIAAAAAAVTVVIVCCKNPKLPLQQNPPPDIDP